MNRDGEKINLWQYARCLKTDCFCKSSSDNLCDNTKTLGITLQLRRGFYHDRYSDIAKVGNSLSGDVHV